MISREPSNQSNNDLKQFAEICDLFQSDPSQLLEKIECFPKFVSRQTLAKFLARYEIFKKVININGSIIECGVLFGAGLFTWAKLSSIFEPSNHTRKIIGFDTFCGFSSISDENDKSDGSSSFLREGGLRGNAIEDIERAIRVFDTNRPLSHIPKIELIKGDICRTADEYVQQNKHLVVSLLYLDVDIFQPTKVAIETFLPRMPKGAVIAFDELNAKIFPGETMAVLETIGVRNIRIERFYFDPYISFAVIE